MELRIQQSAASDIPAEARFDNMILVARYRQEETNMCKSGWRCVGPFSQKKDKRGLVEALLFRNEKPSTLTSYSCNAIVPSQGCVVVQLVMTPSTDWQNAVGLGFIKCNILRLWYNDQTFAKPRCRYCICNSKNIMLSSRLLYVSSLLPATKLWNSIPVHLFFTAHTQYFCFSKINCHSASISDGVVATILDTNNITSYQ